jgi:hypothetical protein
MYTILIPDDGQGPSNRPKYVVEISRIYYIFIYSIVFSWILKKNLAV